MTTKTYSERRQAALFTAARELRRTAAAILDDCVTVTEFQGSTASWAKNQAAVTARLANELEERGHEQRIASTHADTANFKTHHEYAKAIDRFEARARNYGVDPTTIK